MLKTFLRARVHDLAYQNGLRFGEMMPKFRRDAITATRIKAYEFDAAWKGRLIESAPRAALWGYLGIVPAENGVALHNDGTQEFVGARR